MKWMLEKYGTLNAKRTVFSQWTPTGRSAAPSAILGTAITDETATMRLSILSRRVTPGKFANLLCSMSDGYYNLLAEFFANSHWQYFLPNGSFGSGAMGW